MILCQHPYPPFIPEHSIKLIVGTIPPPRFSAGQLFEEDVDFGYGSKYGLLWPILENIFGQALDYENTARAIEQRKNLLRHNRIGICDMVESCHREKMEASDLGMKQVKLRNILELLEKNKGIKRILFMGGNTKNGPEYFFRKQLREAGIKLIQMPEIRCRIHLFSFQDREIEAVSLTSPSSAANRSIGANAHYKKMRSLNSKYSTLDYRIEQYREFFLE